MAGLFVASCLLGLARLLGIIEPTYFANLAAIELDAADLQRGLGVGFAAALAVAFAALSVLLKANFATRYLPPLVYAIAIGYAIHTWGPRYVDAAVAKLAWNANLPGWLSHHLAVAPLAAAQYRHRDGGHYVSPRPRLSTDAKYALGTRGEEWRVASRSWGDPANGEKVDRCGNLRFPYGLERLL